MSPDFYAWEEVPYSMKRLLIPIVNRVVGTRNADANPLGVSFYEFGRDYYVAAKYDPEEVVLHVSERTGECRFIGGVIVNTKTWSLNG